MHTGQCLCGSVRLEIAGEFLHACYCHCSRCRRASASCFATNGFVKAEDLRVVAGEDVIGAFESAPGMFRHFCTRCGSQLFNRNEHVLAIRSVRLGVVDGDPGIRPSCHIFVGSRAPWSLIDDGLPTYLEANVPPPSFTPDQWADARRQRPLRSRLRAPRGARRGARGVPRAAPRLAAARRRPRALPRLEGRRPHDPHPAGAREARRPGTRRLGAGRRRRRGGPGRPARPHDPGRAPGGEDPRAKLFFPEERPFEACTLIRRHWTKADGSTA